MICQIVLATARDEQFPNVFQRARSPGNNFFGCDCKFQ